MRLTPSPRIPRFLSRTAVVVLAAAAAGCASASKRYEQGVQLEQQFGQRAPA